MADPSGGLLRGGIQKVRKHPSKTPQVREPKVEKTTRATGPNTRNYGKNSGGLGPPMPPPFAPGMSAPLNPGMGGI